ncbi:pyroglutamyl-peptidase I [Bdellovibrio sp. HCB-162]|uniref:pyroglutamyl-peptidase I family protein n=1 Tax=Bdellovibrio sp. HCB-162 TaxID=3394234 RepID=UPI0039BCC6E6
MMKAPRILVTGFSPFLGEKINPSEILLEWLKRDFAFQSKVETLLLPVSFAAAASLLESRIAQTSYDYIFMLGQAGGRSKINLERVALNWIETEKPDEDGVTPLQGPIISGKESALFSTLNVSNFKDQLQQKQLPIAVSLSAGGYVCNYVYYKTLLCLQENKIKSQTCFIHVPFLPEQVLDKPDMPSMDLETMKKVLEEILQIALN